MHDSTVIIGASASIGDAVVRAFAARSGHVLATTHATPLSSDLPDNVKGVRLDLVDATSREALVAQIAATGRKIDALVMLAGIINGEPLARYDEAAASRIMAVNFTAQAMLIRDLVPHIAPRGRLILVSSIAAERGSFDPFYAASKGAMIPFAKSLATAHGRAFSTITVLPGPISESTMFNEMTPETQAAHLGRIATGEMLTPAALADILADLCAPHWHHANGAVLRVNGGAYV
jgi:3-oxoacyl-[acyl-carrier protein] reductase